MVTLPGVEHFNRLFKIQLANSHTLRQAAYKIRHCVYCTELGWEPQNSAQIESDEYDDYALHCLFTDRATGQHAGCVRLIIPPADNLNQALPFELNYKHSIYPQSVQADSLTRGSFGEISRLAVLPSYKKSQQEQHGFSNVGMGLYLGVIALADLCQLAGLFMLIEPRLERCLRRYGLRFKQIGEKINHNGIRAMFYLPREKFSSA
ncbi:MAG: N-acyl amino acid synthase of PEP-CTERM/exosortase system, partial [Phenylobacterium sp.]